MRNRARAYSEASVEALRARNLLKDWAGEGFLDPAQYRRMEQETVCDLRRTNIFLRLVLFFFSAIIVGAAVGLFFVMFLQHASQQTTGVFLLIFAAISYAAAEFAVSQGKFYRYGIEEALLVCSVGFLCVGMELAFFTHSDVPGHALEWQVPAAGLVASLWIWRRFGLAYLFFAAMIFAVWVAYLWTSSHPAQHAIIAAFYAVGLIAVVVLRSGDRFTYLDQDYSIAEALLWFGTYVAINLQLPAVDLVMALSFGARDMSDIPKTFYWTTWVLIWCIPPAVLLRGVRRKDRFVMGAGAIAAVLTLATNKPYLGWPRHTWDPMLLGILLIGIALLLRRWLSRGPDGIRHGFTARRLSGKDKQWMNVASTAIGLTHPAPSPQPADPHIQFGGGDSGGGGASSDF